MASHQAGILAPGPSLGRFLFFQLLAGDDPDAIGRMLLVPAGCRRQARPAVLTS